MPGATRLWDYVVVGGGSAGSVVASRLSERPGTTVLLLEAGPDWRLGNAPDALRRPELAGTFALSPAFSRWQRRGVVVRRTTAQAPQPYRQGAGLGGSSVVNGMVTLRPPLSDFERWDDAGCAGWDPASVLASFVRLEDDGMFGDAPHHGRGGPTPIWRARTEQWGPLDRAFVDAARATGHEWVADQNSPEPSGVGLYPGNLLEGARVTANDAYLEPARDRPNLSIEGGAQVESLVLDGSGPSVRGVRYRTSDGPAVVECGDVILCAGAIESAAILLRSGVGPADDLHALEIPVAADLPVGTAIQDHPMIGLGLNAGALGPPAAGRGYEVALRAPSSVDAADPAALLLHPVLNVDPRRGVVAAVFAFVMRCRSRGTLRLTSPQPDEPLRIDERLLSDATDERAMVDALAAAGELLRRLDGRRGGVVSIGGRVVPIRSLTRRDVDRRWLAEVVGDAKHICGSCPMGRAGDGVVDGDARVHGLDGVRVADLSIVPFAPRANPYLTALMIGEHVAARLGAVSTAGR